MGHRSQGAALANVKSAPLAAMLSKIDGLFGGPDACRQRGLDCTIDTCGYTGREALLEAAQKCGLILYDLKLMDDARHREWTEASNQKILANLRQLSARGHPIRVRIPVILPGERTSTLVEPGKSVYASLGESDPVSGILDASLWVGYVWADEPRSSASVVVTGADPANVRREAEKIARRYWDTRKDFAFGAPAGSAA